MSKEIKPKIQNWEKIKEEREILWEQIFSTVEDIILITKDKDILKKDLGLIQHYIEATESPKKAKHYEKDNQK